MSRAVFKWLSKNQNNYSDRITTCSRHGKNHAWCDWFWFWFWFCLSLVETDWRDSFKPINKRSIRNLRSIHVITFDSHLKTAVLLCACQVENHFFGSVCLRCDFYGNVCSAEDIWSGLGIYMFNILFWVQLPILHCLLNQEPI